MLADRYFHHEALQRAWFAAAHAEEWARDVVAGARRGLCAMHGHDVVLRFESRRLSLCCVSCGWESSGWTIDGPRFFYSSDRSRIRGDMSRRRPLASAVEHLEVS